MVTGARDGMCTAAAWQQKEQTKRCSCPSLLEQPHYVPKKVNETPIEIETDQHAANISCMPFSPHVFFNITAQAYGELLRSPFFFVRKVDDGALPADVIASYLLPGMRGSSAGVLVPSPEPSPEPSPGLGEERADLAELAAL